MRHVLLAAIALSLPVAVTAGEVTIGKDPFGLYPKWCHLAIFAGPGTAVADYQKTAKERVETADPAVVERLRGVVSVSVVFRIDKTSTQCLDDTPQRLVFLSKGQAEPTLVIPLKIEDREAKNRMGAVWTVHNGFAEVALADIEKLRGKEFELRVIFAERVQKETWKKDFTDKVLE